MERRRIGKDDRRGMYFDQIEMKYADGMEWDGMVVAARL